MPDLVRNNLLIDLLLGFVDGDVAVDGAANCLGTCAVSQDSGNYKAPNLSDKTDRQERNIAGLKNLVETFVTGIQCYVVRGAHL